MKTEHIAVVILVIISIYLLYKIMDNRELFQVESQKPVFHINNLYRDYKAPSNPFLDDIDVEGVEKVNVNDLNISRLPLPLCGDSFSKKNIKKNYLLLDKPIKDERLIRRPRTVYEFMFGFHPSLIPTKPIFI